MSYWTFWLWRRSQPVSQWLLFALDTARLMTALMHFLKAWLFINFLYTIFRYTPGLGNDQLWFFHVVLLLLFSYISMENHGVGPGLTSGNQCFQPIYLWIVFLDFFSAFLMKTLKMPWPFFFSLLAHKKIAKLSHLQTCQAATWVCRALAGTKWEMQVRKESWVE